LTGMVNVSSVSATRQTHYYNKLTSIFSVDWEVQAARIDGAEAIQRAWKAYTMKKRLSNLTKVISAAISESNRSMALQQETSASLNALVEGYLDPEKAEQSFGVTQDQLNHADPKKVMLMLSAQVARVQAEQSLNANMMMDRMARFQKEMMIIVASGGAPAQKASAVSPPRGGGRLQPLVRAKNNSSKKLGVM